MSNKITSTTKLKPVVTEQTVAEELDNPSKSSNPIEQARFKRGSNTTDSYKCKLPRYIQSRLDHYIEDLLESNSNGKHLVLGARPSSHDIVLQSNDYLSLANNPYIKSRLKSEIEETADSIFMSAIFLQDEETKPDLETQLAEYVNFDHCLLSQSGWTANIGLLQTICAPDSQVYIDFFAHMSLWEGARYANANVHPFMHNNVKHLAKLIRRNGPGVILVDSIYSTLGTVAPIEQIVELAKQTGCALVVDESHSLGVIGEQGRGLVAQLNLSEQVDFLTASLAKTFAYRAGAIWSNNNAAKCIPFVSYPAIFSSTILPYEVAALEATLEVIKQGDDRREHLFKMADRLKAGLCRLGISIRSESQIIALETGEEANTEKVRDFLESYGVFGAVFCRPATPKNRNLIRLSLNSDVTEKQIDKIIHVCRLAQQHEELYFV